MVTPPPPPVSYIPPLVPFGFPDISLGGGGEQITPKKRKSKKSARDFTPSYIGAAFGIKQRASEKKTAALTGLTLRGI